MTSRQDPPAGERGREHVALYERVTRARFVKRILAFPLIDRMLAPTRGDSSVNKFVRYTMVSGVAVVISQVALILCTAVFGLSGIASNTVAAVVSTPASYELNRKWAWGKSGKSHLWREVAPFWAFTLVGYLGSTGTVQLADSMTKSHGVHGILRVLAIMVAQLFAYGVVWIVKFLVFNHVIFVTRPGDAEGIVAAGTSASSAASSTGDATGSAGTPGAATPAADGNGSSDDASLVGGRPGEGSSGDGSPAGERLVPGPRY